MGAGPYPSYEDAASEYRTKLHELAQLPESGDIVDPRHAEEIADISSSLIERAQGYLDSADPAIREGIRGHFIDQATVELLLATELVRAARAGTQPSAARRATQNAALGEAISAAETSSAVPVAQGLPTDISLRAAESATIDEAASGLKLAVLSTVASISHRVEELGRDIAFDLVSGIEWTEVDRAAALDPAELEALMQSIPDPTAAKILRGVHRRITALLGDRDRAARGKILQCLAEIHQAGKSELFGVFLESLFETEEVKKNVSARMDRHGSSIESINKVSDLVKAYSDRFMVLAGRLRKLEDAIRLGKLVEVPPLLVSMTALRVEVLAALVYAGQDYIQRGVAGILQGEW
jgi:hypothetical protein